MKVLIYSSGNGEFNRRLVRVAGVLIPPENIDIHHTIESFRSRLNRPGRQWGLIVALAASQQELRDISSFGSLLDDTRLMLILPDRSKESLKTGLSLRPRFLSYIDGDFIEIAAVLGYMLGRQRTKEA